MKRIAVAICVGLAAGGCGSSRPNGVAPSSGRTPSQSTSSDQQVVARVGSRKITIDQLQRPLIEAYGLNVLLNLVQLELAKDLAQRSGVSVTPQDIENEKRQTISKMFSEASQEDYDALLQQFLSQQKLTPQEFEIVITTNAYLRKVAEPKVEGAVTEEALREEFNRQYGETVRVRHIQLSNIQEITEAQRRLAEGQPFEKVAKDLSRNDITAPLGGEIQPAFSRSSPKYPQAFKETAFLLKVGEVSDPVMAGGSYHLIKMDERIEPKAVKFEDVKESLREAYSEMAVQTIVKQLRAQLGRDALQSLRIEEPTLREQFEQRRSKREAQVRDRDEVRKNLEKQRDQAAEQDLVPGTVPAEPSTGASPDDMDQEPATTPQPPAAPDTSTAPAAQAAPATMPAQ